MTMTTNESFPSLPKTFKNYKGEDVVALYPKKGVLINAIDDQIFLFKTSKCLYVVVYGLQVEEMLCVDEAFRIMGDCYKHSHGL